MKIILALLLCFTFVLAAQEDTAVIKLSKIDSLTVKIEKMNSLLTKTTEDKLSSLSINANKMLEEKEKKDALEAEFAGLSWGMGVSWTLDNKNNRVNKAEVIDSLVRITDEDNVKVRLLAELHYFFELPDKLKKGLLSKYQTTCHWGPFVAIDTQDFKKLDGAGGGVMLGFRNEKASKSFNIGIGWMVDQNSKELGTGLEEGKPLPAGAENIWYKTRSQGGIVLITSFTFEP